MRILHVFDHSIPLHSGYAFRSVEIIKNQRLLGWETVHLTSSKQYKQKEKIEKVDNILFYRTFQSLPFLNNLPILDQYSVVLDLKRAIKEVCKIEKPDIIHAHSPCLNGLAAIKVGKRLKIPVVYEMRASWEDAAVSHGTTRENSVRYRISRILETYVLKKTNAITTICNGLKQDIISRGIDKDKITVIPNAVNVDDFSVDNTKDYDLLQKYNLENKIIIGFIGSFYEYEGLDLLIDSFKEISNEFSNVKLMLVGGGQHEKELKGLVNKYRLHDSVIFTGRIDHEMIQKYYNLIDIFVYPRRSIRLTEIVTPLKPLEAIASGKIFVASNVGGHNELIEKIPSGKIFQANSSPALTEAIYEVIKNREEWVDRLKAAREYIEKVRNWKVSVEGYKEVYERLLEAV